MYSDKIQKGASALYHIAALVSIQGKTERLYLENLSGLKLRGNFYFFCA